MSAKSPDSPVTLAVKKWLWEHTFAWVEGGRSWSCTERGWTIAQPDWSHWRGQCFTIEWAGGSWREVPAQVLADWIELLRAGKCTAAGELLRAYETPTKDTT